MDNQIKWKRGDYIRLGQAVSQFNKKIRELKQEENSLYLPDELSYKDLKNRIVTRKELNRQLKKLKAFQEAGAEDLTELEGGQKLTKWEKQYLKEEQSRMIERLQGELKDEFKQLSNGYSKAQMGSLEYNQIQAQINDIRFLDKSTGAEFKKLVDRIIKGGTTDYTMRKAIVYRENYIEEMKKYSNFKNYKKLMKKLNSIRNPLKFYDTLSNISEVVADLTYQSDEYYSQMEFNRFVEEVIGEEIEQDDNIKEFMDFKYETKKGSEIEF